MRSAILLYDSDCGFCRWALAKVLAWDRRGALLPVPIDSAEGDRLLGGMPDQEKMASWHLVDPQGRLHSAGAAFAPLFRLLPGGGPFGALAERAPRATQRAYGVVAGNRSAFGRLVTDGAKLRADRRIADRKADARVG